MGKKGCLGEFEHIVLLALVRLQADSPGRAVYAEIDRLASTTVAITAVYVTLSRLEKKGYVSSTLAAPTPVRGGRATKCFRIEAAGLSALRRSRQQLERFWDGVEIGPDPDAR